MHRKPGDAAPPPESRDRSGEAQNRDESARAGQGYRAAAHLSQLGQPRGRAGHGIQRLGRSCERSGPYSDHGFHALAVRPDGLHAGNPQPGGPRPTPADDHGARAGRICSGLLPDPDGRRSARALCRAQGCLPVHQGRPGRLGRKPHPRRRGGRLRRYRTQGPQQRRMVYRWRHRCERALGLARARFPRSGHVLSCRNLP